MQSFVVMSNVETLRLYGSCYVYFFPDSDCELAIIMEHFHVNVYCRINRPVATDYNCSCHRNCCHNLYCYPAHLLLLPLLPVARQMLQER